MDEDPERDPGVATAGGIRHGFRVIWKSKQVQEWDREGLRAHTYLYTDKGPFRHWQHRIRRAASAMCPCGEAVQNASSHMMNCHLVEGGERSAENEEFCRAVYQFLKE